MKKTICRLCAVCLLFAMLFLTGCAGSFFAEEDLQIVSVEAVPTTEGYTKLIITYSDDSERDPDVFAIPDGEQGKEGEKGTGIAKISYQHDDNNLQTGVTIEFTDKTLEPVTFDIPDGRSVVGVEPYSDSIGSGVIFKYSDGTTSDVYYLPKGDRGRGIKTFSCTQNNDMSVNIDIEIDDFDPINVFIPAPAEGRGVAEMTAGEIGKDYYIDVTFSDGTQQTLTFERPSKWYSGMTVPVDTSGVDGDYFFDTAHDKIYLKENGEWVEIVSFNMESYTVEFNLNDEGDASMTTNVTRYTVERGAYFSADGNGDIPIPVRPGYTFKGWYSKKVLNPATMSPFTDFTPVFSDLTLYAIWEKN